MPKAWKSDFAQKQLEKHGWTDGSGLGRLESGIKEAIKVKIKNDTAGVGHDPGKEFTHHWWDHVFNKAAQSIEVNHTEDGITVTKSICNVKKKLKKDLLYGNFVKAATLTSEGTEVKEDSISTDSSDTDNEEEKVSSLTKLTDTELVRICGGRTAHKGARHGFGMNAKLARIDQQEKQQQCNADKQESDTIPKKKQEFKKYLEGLNNVTCFLSGKSDSSDGNGKNTKMHVHKKKSKNKKSKVKCESNINTTNATSVSKNQSDFHNIAEQSKMLTAKKLKKLKENGEIYANTENPLIVNDNDHEYSERKDKCEMKRKHPKGN